MRFFSVSEDDASLGCGHARGLPCVQGQSGVVVAGTVRGTLLPHTPPPPAAQRRGAALMRRQFECQVHRQNMTFLKMFVSLFVFVFLPFFQGRPRCTWKFPG